MSDDEAVVNAAVEAAESVIFSRLTRSEIEDIDVTVRFADRELEIDVYVNVPGAETAAETVVEDAALAARAAVDDLLE